jgi:hypothetical protein
MKHGSFWNPHKFKKTSENTRICQKCGRCELFDIYPSQLGWKQVDLATLKMGIIKDNESMSSRKQKEIRVLEWRKNSDGFLRKDGIDAIEYLREMNKEQ